jgi:hypothetical protein
VFTVTVLVTQVNEMFGEHAESSISDVLVHTNTTWFQNYSEIIMDQLLTYGCVERRKIRDVNFDRARQSLVPKNHIPLSGC